MNNDTKTQWSIYKVSNAEYSSWHLAGAKKMSSE